MNDARSRVVVIGGGIGGASAALGLQRAGIDVSVFERSPQRDERDDGLQIWVNAMVALDELGLADAVQSFGEPMELEELRSWRGSLLTTVPVKELVEKYELPGPVLVRRPDLVKALTGALEEGVLRYDTSFEGLVQDREGITLRLADGREARAAVVVAADGLDSSVRTMLFGPIEPKVAGYRYLSALTTHQDPSVPPGMFQLSFGRGDRFGIHAGSRWTYWFGVLVAPPESDDPPEGRRRQLLDRFRRFGRAITDFIEASDEETIDRADIRDIDPLARWVEGRVALLGDAAHAATPNLGRGAGDAIEDAVAFADCLSTVARLEDHDAATDALRRYEERRRPDATTVQARARRIGKLASWKNPAAVAFREQIMRRIAGPAMLKETEEEFAMIADAIRVSGHAPVHTREPGT
jgi:2-polyprenyl-6-methoxyphenol hydroxylase-like FAD-dependent oxidoreductase